MLTASIADSTRELTTFNGIGSRTYERQSKGHQGEAVKAQWWCYFQTFGGEGSSLVSWSIFEPVCVCISFCIGENRTRGAPAHTAWSTDLHSRDTRWTADSSFGPIITR